MSQPENAMSSSPLFTDSITVDTSILSTTTPHQVEVEHHELLLSLTDRFQLSNYDLAAGYSDDSAWLAHGGRGDVTAGSETPALTMHDDDVRHLALAEESLDPHVMLDIVVDNDDDDGDDDGDGPRGDAHTKMYQLTYDDDDNDDIAILEDHDNEAAVVSPVGTGIDGDSQTASFPVVLDDNDEIAVLDHIDDDDDMIVAALVDRDHETGDVREAMMQQHKPALADSGESCKPVTSSADTPDVDIATINTDDGTTLSTECRPASVESQSRDAVGRRHDDSPVCRDDGRPVAAYRDDDGNDDKCINNDTENFQNNVPKYLDDDVENSRDNAPQTAQHVNGVPVTDEALCLDDKLHPCDSHLPVATHDTNSEQNENETVRKSFEITKPAEASRNTDDDDGDRRQMPTATVDTSSQPVIIGVLPDSGIIPCSADCLSGQLIAEVPIYTGPCCYTPANNCIPNELHSHDIQVHPETYRQLFNTVTSQCFVRHHYCFTGYWLCLMLLVWTAITTSLALLAILWCHYITSPYSPLDVTIVICVCAAITALPLIVVWCAATCICCRMARRFSDVMRLANELMHGDNILVCCRDEGCCGCRCNRLVMLLYYYEWQRCEVYVKNLLDQPDCILIDVDVSDVDDDVPLLIDSPNNDVIQRLPAAAVGRTSQEQARQLLLWHAVEYGKLLAERKLATPRERRHTRQGECLCQFIESVNQQSTDRRCSRLWRLLTRRKQVNSRRPWKDMFYFY